MPYTPIQKLEIILQQCNDRKNLHPDTNKNGCIDCLQSVYVGEKYQPGIADLAFITRKLWFEFDRDTFFQAFRTLRKQNGSRAFDDTTIHNEAVKYFDFQKRFTHPGTIANTEQDSAIVRVGEIGLTGKITRMVVSTDVSDQNTGGTDGSEWAIRIVRNNTLIHHFSFPIHLENHKPLLLRNMVITKELPLEIKSKDIVELGAFRYYPAHIAKITNTTLDLYIDINV